MLRPTLTETFINQTRVAVGDKIECNYADKPRIGFVEAIYLGGPMTVLTNKGYRSFTRSKINSLKVIS